MRSHADARRIGRHQQHARRRPPRDLHQHREQPGDRRIGDAILDAIDDPIVCRTSRPWSSPPPRSPPAGDNSRRAAYRCPARGRRRRDDSGRRPGTSAATRRAAHRSCTRSNSRCASRELSDSTAAMSASPAASSSVTMQRRERIGAGAAAILRQRQAAQAHLRGLVEQIDRAGVRSHTSSRSALSATGLISRVTKSRTVSRISNCSELR